MKKSRLLGALCLCVGFLPFPGSAATFAIDNMTITGGRFEYDIGSGIFLGFTLDTTGPNTDLVSGYIGNGGSGRPKATPDPDSIVGVSDFGGLPINVYTALENLGDDNTQAGDLTGGLVPTGTLDDTANTIEMDLSSWFANVNDTDFHAGTRENDDPDDPTSEHASGTWDPLTGSYSLSWTSVTTLFDTTVWTLEGVATPVPVPAAVWLFGSGLLGLVGIARRKTVA
jgi:hypothetical protein